MSDHFYGVNKGHGFDPFVVSTGTSTTGKSIELRLHDGDGLIRMEVLKALKTLEAYFEKSGAVTP
jgi:hypothetical protein